MTKRRPAADQRVVDTFVKDGRLVQMPARHAKRRIVLDAIAQRFEIGTTYSETEVNAILRELYDDVAALRRYLVDEDFLSRADGRYWRSGGAVEV
jgi:hypothetical protein